MQALEKLLVPIFKANFLVAHSVLNKPIFKQNSVIQPFHRYITQGSGRIKLEFKKHIAII